MQAGAFVLFWAGMPGEKQLGKEKELVTPVIGVEWSEKKKAWQFGIGVLPQDGKILCFRELDAVRLAHTYRALRLLELIPAMDWRTISAALEAADRSREGRQCLKFQGLSEYFPSEGEFLRLREESLGEPIRDTPIRTLVSKALEYRLSVDIFELADEANRGLIGKVPEVEALFKKSLRDLRLVTVSPSEGVASFP